MRLDVESLRVFHQTIHAGGVNSAAKRLHLSQSAVSHKLKRLEQKVGEKLFTRDGHDYLLTQSGRQLMTYAERMVALHDEAVSSLNGSSLEGNIRLGSTENIALDGLTNLLRSFRQQNPLLGLRITVAQSLVLQKMLAAGEVDLALLQIPIDEVKSTDLFLWQDDLIWVGAKDVDYSHLDPLPLISFGDDCFHLPILRKALASKGKSHFVQLECGSHEGVFRSVRDGFGVTVINQRAKPDFLKQLDSSEFGDLGSIAYVARRRTLGASEVMSSLETCIQQMEV